MKLSFRPRLAALVLLAALLEAAFLALGRLLAPPPDVVGVIAVALAASVVYFAAARLAWRWVEPGRGGRREVPRAPPPFCAPLFPLPPPPRPAPLPRPAPGGGGFPPSNLLAVFFPRGPFRVGGGSPRARGEPPV